MTTSRHLNTKTRIDVALMQQMDSLDNIFKVSPTISVGILSADLMNISGDLEQISKTDIKMLHFDVMDGCFVPLMTAGPPLIMGIKTELYKDIHLMINNPEEKVEDYINAGADMVTVHVESGSDILSLLKKLGRMINRNGADRGLVRGVAINPATPLDVLDPLLDDVEMVAVLAVDPTLRKMPGCSEIHDRCARVKEKISATGRRILLTVDGGVKMDNISDIARIGADIVVSGSAIFKDKTIVDNSNFMLHALKSAG